MQKFSSFGGKKQKQTKIRHRIVLRRLQLAVFACRWMQLEALERFCIRDMGWAGRWINDW